MLEIRNYTRAEIAAELGIAETVQNLKQCIDRKLKRIGVDFTSNGRGAATVYHILSLPDFFKLFCMTEFGCAPNTDFKKLRDVLYFALNDPDSLSLPDTGKEYFLSEQKIGVSRGTIKGYIQRLIDAEYLGGAEPRYLAVRAYKDHYESEIISRERYCSAWEIYWSIRYEIGYVEAYSEMYSYLNGHPLKHMRPSENALKADKLEELQEYIRLSYEKDLWHE